MSARAGLYATLAVLALCMSQTLLAAELDAPPAVIRQMSSPDVAVRREAVRALLPQRIAELEPTVAVQLALIASKDEDPWTRQAALGGLGVLTAMAGLNGAASDIRNSPLARAIYEHGDLRERLMSIVREDASFDVVVAAAVPLLTAFGSEPDTESAILDRIDTIDSPAHQTKLLRTLAIGGLDGPRTTARVGDYMSDGKPIGVRRVAADLLLMAASPPQGRFEDYFKLLEDPQTFADPALLHALPRFKIPPERYLGRLVAMQTRLTQELAKPADERTITVYNDAFVRRSLEEAIAREQRRMRSLSPGGTR